MKGLQCLLRNLGHCIRYRAIQSFWISRVCIEGQPDCLKEICSSDCFQRELTRDEKICQPETPVNIRFRSYVSTAALEAAMIAE